MTSRQMYYAINGERFGPVAETTIQRKLRDEQIPEDCYVWAEGMADWQPIDVVLVRLATKDQKDGLRALGLSVPRGITLQMAYDTITKVIGENPEKAQVWSAWFERRQKRNEIVKYCESQSPPLRLSTFFLEEILEREQLAKPDAFSTINPQDFIRLVNVEHPIHTWRDDPATEPQLRLLRSNSVPLHDGMTKGEAHDIIDMMLNGATEGQQRRLSYYGIDSKNVTKDKQPS